MLHLEGILPLRTYQNHHQEKLNLPKRHNLKTEKKNQYVLPKASNYADCLSANSTL